MTGWRGAGKLRGIGVGHAQHVAGKFHHGHLHTQADAQEGHPVFPGIADGGNHALDAPVAEAAGHQYTVAALQDLGHVLLRQLIGLHPPDVHHRVVGRGGVVQGFHHGQIAS